ncbi:MAG TPA: hypothetical protein VFO05_04950 [Candidatus Limnocylindrales bacterium]|nr:hypothetical protein [Candidatus Limnocylindrales bacterium]
MTRRPVTRAGVAALFGSALAAAALAAPAAVAAHSLNVTYQSRLPLAVYLAGAALTVGLSFAFVMLADVRAEPPPPPGPAKPPPAWLRYGLRAIGLIGWSWIVLQGILGGQSAGDVKTLFLWVYGWVGIAIVSAVIGPVWHWLDPFSTLHDIGARAARAVGIKGWEPAEYPARLGKWPAAIGLVFIVWLELVGSVSGSRMLFIVLVGYTAFTLAMMAQFGRDAWRSEGETFSVWFRLLGRLAPYGLDAETGSVRRRPFATGLLEADWSILDIAIIGIGTASILFDGLSQTTPWFAVFGAPDVPIKTLQLLGFVGLIVVAALAVARLVGTSATGAGLLPIAAGYLIAHYFTYLLIDGQRIIVAIADPLQQGWDLGGFGWAFFEPTQAFLPPGLVWTVQIAAVVGGHMLGAWAGHVVYRADPAHADGLARRREVPLAVIMVALTTLTLWSLGQTLVVEVEGDQAAAPAGRPHL